ncbi:MAG: membrane protein insertion efficiency factor YidD [Actinomycetota bacterium]
MRLGSVPLASAKGAVRFYRRWISPMTGPHCRFVPSCSEYAMLVLEEFGLGRGSWLAVKRLLRCHPFCAGGLDPAPRREV